MTLFISPAMGYIVPQFSFDKYSFNIKYPRKFDLPLTNETETEILYSDT